MLEELKRAKIGRRASTIQSVHNELENMVYRKEITYEEIIDILDVKYIAGSPICYTLPTGVSEFSDPNLMMKLFFPKR